MEEFIQENWGTLMWLGVAIIAAIVEGSTVALVSIWFVPGALAALIFSLCGVDLWIQFVVFIAVTALFLVLSKTVWKKYLHPKTKFHANADAILEERGIVDEEINNLLGTGSVKIKGLTWTARAADDALIIPAGTVVTVKEIVGVKAICEPAQQPNQTK